MPDLNELKTKVEGLSKTMSSDQTFRETYQLIEAASKIPENTHSNELSDIVTIFRDDKLPGRPTLNRTRADAKDLDENLKLDSVAKSISAIDARNAAIRSLDEKLAEQAKKAKKDASLLKTIKDILDKTTATVDVIKNFINDLEESDKPAKDGLKASVDALAKISTIFKPQNN